MPKTDIDYSNTIIYKIVCNDLNVTDCYVGHTTNFVKRKYLHKSDCTNENNNKYNLKVYKIIRENGGWENWSMIEIEKYTECKDKNEAEKRERYWLENLKANLNSQLPTITIKEYREYQKEYREQNKEQIAEYMKQYQKQYREQNKEQNKEQIAEYQKQYREKNKDKIDGKKKKNKEQIAEYQKQYYEHNKEQIAEYQKQYYKNKKEKEL